MPWSPEGEYNPQPDYTVDKPSNKGDDCMTTVRRPLHTVRLKYLETGPLPKLDEGNLRFVVTLIILGTIALQH